MRTEDVSVQETSASDEAPPREPFPVVGIGCSAGGLEALKAFFAGIPGDSGLAFVVVQHLHPEKQSLLAELLAPHVAMPVVQIADGMPVQPNRVYVILPNALITLEDGRLRLREPADPRERHKPIDRFFESLAREQRERAICVILSGTGTNGTIGMRALKAEGGMAMVQTPETAEFDGTPHSAISTGLVDFVLPVERMPEALLRYARHPYLRDAARPAHEERHSQQFNEILALLHARTGHDFRSYKRPTLTRRIHRRMGLLHLERLGAYVDVLRNDPNEVKALVQDLLITVTNFFRDPEAWEVFEREVVIPLVQHREPDNPIRAWVPACSTGEEAYTMAVVLVDHLEAVEKSCEVKVFATDPADHALTSARLGTFPESIEPDFHPDRLRRFFEKVDHQFLVTKRIRELVTFAPHNLLSDPPFSRLDIISCRNLMIYLEPEAQARLIAPFHFALRDGGVLFLGNAETIGRQEDLFEPISKKWRIYRKVGQTHHSQLRLPAFDLYGRRRSSASDAPSRRRPPAPSELVNQTLLEGYAPASVLIDQRYQIIHYHGPTDRYISQPTGAPTRDLRQLLRDGLAAKLRGAVYRALTEGRAVSVGGARLTRGDETADVTITARPVRQVKEDEALVVVSFEERASFPRGAGPDDGAGAEAGVAEHLESQLRSAREELEGTIEELETTNEELKAANEEVTSTNEELQSTNEELETSKEELQSLNEELNTVNHQLTSKVDELEQSNNDLGNLLTSTDIAVLFLDTQFRIRRFTPTTRKLMHLLQSDVGRPLSDLARKFTDETLLPDARAVLERLVPVEKEIRTDGDGLWYLRRVLPYRTDDNRIDGIVVTFTEITARKRIEEDLRELNQTLEQHVARRTTSIRLLHEVTVIANEATSVEDALRRTLERVCRHLGWPLAHACVTGDGESESVLTTGIWYVESPERNRRFVEAAEALEPKCGSDLAARVLATGEPEWVGDVSAEGRRPGREALAGHGIRSAAAFPVRVRERVAGVLEFFDDKPAQPDDVLMQGMEQIGTQVGRVIERAELQREIARMSEQEQRRFAQELHDSIAQQLTGLAMMAEATRQDLEAAESPLAGRGGELVAHIRNVQKQVRNLARGLMPVEVDAEGLMAALEGLTERAGQMSGLTCRFACEEPVPIENSTAATHLYHIAQEAVHNALKHAGATEITVSLDQFPLDGERIVSVSVRDDGQGLKSATQGTDGMGRRIMQYRAGLIGATLEIRSEAGRGMTVTCRLRQVNPEKTAAGQGA